MFTFMLLTVILSLFSTVYFLIKVVLTSGPVNPNTFGTTDSQGGFLCTDTDLAGLSPIPEHLHVSFPSFTLLFLAGKRRRDSGRGEGLRLMWYVVVSKGVGDASLARWKKPPG